MIEMELSKIVIDEKRQDQLIALKEKGGSRRIAHGTALLNEQRYFLIRHPPGLQYGGSAVRGA